MNHKELLKQSKCPYCNNTLKPNMRIYNATVDFSFEFGLSNGIYYDYPNIIKFEFIDIMCSMCDKVLIKSNKKNYISDFVEYLKTLKVDKNE